MPIVILRIVSPSCRSKCSVLVHIPLLKRPSAEKNANKDFALPAAIFVSNRFCQGARVDSIAVFAVAVRGVPMAQMEEWKSLLF
jgi:hypothetical protein